MSLLRLCGIPSFVFPGDQADTLIKKKIHLTFAQVVFRINKLALLLNAVSTGLAYVECITSHHTIELLV